MSNAQQAYIETIRRLMGSPAVIPAILKNYLVLLLFKKKVLRNLQLAVNYDCQYRCSLCSTMHLRKDKDILRLSQILKMIKEAKDLGCINVNLTGGEPLLHPDIRQIIRAISKSGLMVGLITNGGLADSVLFRRLKAAGLTELAVSLHGDEEYHDEFTGVKGSYAKAVRCIEQAKAGKLNVVINTVITHSNLNSQCIKELQRVARFYNILIQPILLCSCRAQSLDTRFALSGEDLQKLKSLLLRGLHIRPSLHRNYFGSTCPAGDEYIYIGAYGDVFMCDLVQTAFGNALEEPLVSIWQRMLKARKDIGHNHTCIGLMQETIPHQAYAGIIN